VAGPEYVQVEEPLIRQLEAMGWEHLAGAPPGMVTPKDPSRSGRESFAEVLLSERLRAYVHKINLRPGVGPWLDDQRVSQVIGQLTRLGAPSLLENNRLATELLLDGVLVDGLPGWDGGRQQRVHLIDWKHPERNDFVVVSQFRVDIPGAQGRKCVVPDEVLLVNGIPLVVIECKKPSRGDAIAEAVKQLQRYAETRHAQAREGNERLFRTVQLTVATSGDRARLGTFTGDAEHYVPWRDPYPLTVETLAAELDKDVQAVVEQDKLAAVVLQPKRLLDIVHNYVTFMTTDEGRVVKIAPRYQQFRAVEKTIDRLLTGETRPLHGKDTRGGIIWHTQGSGKSLTMTFLVRKMRVTAELAETKVVLVTDRTQLQGQLDATMQLAGETTTIARNVKMTKELLGRHGPGVVFVMIQKQQDIAARKAQGADELTDKVPSLGELNTDESIVVMIDEAHRSHGSRLHNNLLDALPNCARIGFTGTPIVMGKRKKTTEIFGTFIDQYRLFDAERDDAVVKIFYEGHTVKGAVRDGRDLDEVFEDMFAEQTDEEREELQRRYATRGDVLEAEDLIAAKARHLLRHYVGTVLPGRFKAQLVAHSRKAAVRYRDALIVARDAMVREAENLPAHLRDVDPRENDDLRKGARIQAYKDLALLKAMDFVPVISVGTGNDEEYFSEWTDAGKQETRIKAFKKDFPPELGDSDHPVAFLIVKSMLLTGFDAPIEQVLYIDRSLKQAELLQAVARVNRTATGKKCGYVVDYFGVANHLKDALQAYAAEDVADVLKDLGDEIGKLDGMRRRLRALFTQHGVTPGADTLEQCVRLLGDGQLYDRFEAELTRFLTTVDIVMPDPAVRPYLGDATLYAEIQMRARRRYRIDDGEFDPSLYGEKVRELIDHHLVSLGIEQKLPPVSLTADDFAEKVSGLPGARAKASEMEHAIRHHIEVNFGKDPRRYRLLSERLEEILRRHKEDWEQQVAALADLVAQLRDDRADPDDPLSPVERALYGVLLEATQTDFAVDEDTDRLLCDMAVSVHRMAIEVTHRRDFWRPGPHQRDFARKIAQELIVGDVCELGQEMSIADRLLDVVRSNRTQIPRPT
jgi:type I restriction enzyme R subunit